MTRSNRPKSFQSDHKRKSLSILALEADINSLYGKSHLGLGQMDEAITRHRLEFQVAKRTGNEDIKYRAMDNLAVSKLFFHYITALMLHLWLLFILGSIY